jgi:hypothetical protein
LANELGDQYQEARAHQGLARVTARRGDDDAAEAHNRIALALFTQLATPEAAEVAAELAGHGKLGEATGSEASGPASR